MDVRQCLLFSVLFCFMHSAFVKSLTDFETKYHRTLIYPQVNPNCNLTWCQNASSTDDGFLTHLVARGDKDELHHIFCTIGAPSLMISRTAPNTKLHVNYDELLSQDNSSAAVWFENKPDHSFGMIFSNLYEYDDFNDTANLTDYKMNISANHRHDLTNLHWRFLSIEMDGGTTIVINATASHETRNSSNNSTLFQKGGYLSFRIRYDPGDHRLTSRPHMENTANSSILTVVMANLTTMFPSSRFALEMVMFSVGDQTDENRFSQVDLKRSLDDEYSPGVFEMRNWLANFSKPREKAWGYAQWKPVVYNRKERLNADLSKASSYSNLKQNRHAVLQRLPGRSLFKACFYHNLDGVSLNATNVSYGSTNDKFFENTKYLVWTLGMGMGPAPEDDVSTLVILVIAVGLGIPLLLMIAATVYVCIKNIRAGRSEPTYTSING